MAMLPPVSDLGLFMGESWKSLAGSTGLCFQLPIHLPQLLSTSDAGQFEKQTYSDPYLSEDSNPGSGNVKQGSSGHSPHDNEVCQGDHISSSGNILKMGRGSMRKARNCKSQIQGWGYISPSDKFQQEPVLDLGFIQSNSLIQEGWEEQGGERQCRHSFLSLARLLGSQGCRLQWGQTGKKHVVRATSATAISLGEVSMEVTLAPLFSFTSCQFIPESQIQVVSRKSYQMSS